VLELLERLAVHLPRGIQLALRPLLLTIRHS
jgi:hypothetical protein